MTEDLERLVRDGLRARADRVDTGAPVVAAARRTVRRRRGVRAGLAAACAVVVVASTAAHVTRDAGPDSSVPTDAPTAAVDPGPVEGGWRTERWHDLAVDVPADWAYGPAPLGIRGDAHICGDLPRRPYVGRPVYLSDVCIGGDYLRESVAPYVWLGADVEPGLVRLDGGTVQETVEAAGTTLTVAGDEALRRAVIGSARTGGSCPSSFRGAPTRPLPLPETEGLLVCAYREEPGDLLRLVGGQVLEAEAARHFASAYDAEEPFFYRCADPHDAAEMVLLQSGERQWLVRFRCTGIRELGGDTSLRGLTMATVVPWARGFVPAVVYGPTGGKGAMIDAFIGTLG